MSELALSGAVLAIISLALIAVGLATGRMPLNERLDTERATAPNMFWALFAFSVFIGFLGLAVMSRHLN